MAAWHGGALVGFDLETTGTEPGESRIVTAAVVEVRGGEGRARPRGPPVPRVPNPAPASPQHPVP
ncbi:3'-5' exonuclease, partial [Streptomyces goshikiensis]